MIQEYLFSDKKQRTSVKKYKPQSVHVEYSDIKGSECWIVSYLTTSNSEKSAKLLSKVNDYVLAEFQPIVLTNESAAYFNRSLYPVINEFERKLRKLLYLKSALNKGETASGNIEDLEAKDLGTIFELLFTDEKFVKNVRKVVNEKTWQFSRDEIIKSIKNLSEETLWKKRIGENSAPTLQKEYITVKDYRNDVMHAHNISYEEYREAKSLFKRINKQLDTEVGLILAVAERLPNGIESSDYNAALSAALLSMKQSFATSEYAQLMATIQASISPSMLQLQKIASTIPELSPEYYATLSRIADEMNTIQSYIDKNGLATAFSDYSNLIQNIQPPLGAMNNLSNEPKPKDKGSIQEKENAANEKDRYQSDDDTDQGEDFKKE